MLFLQQSALSLGISKDLSIGVFEVHRAADITHHYSKLKKQSYSGEGKMFPKISVCERCCCTADIAKPTEEESGGERGRDRIAEPASAAAVTVKEGRGEEEQLVSLFDKS